MPNRAVGRSCSCTAGPRVGVLEVARLVVDRKINRDIATELFVSLKTVESHIRNLFHKLDVSSRVEVARVVERAERARSALP
jgi:DNA-binding NarL/FixJ family response regulator